MKELLTTIFTLRPRKKNENIPAPSIASFSVQIVGLLLLSVSRESLLVAIVILILSDSSLSVGDDEKIIYLFIYATLVSLIL